MTITAKDKGRESESTARDKKKKSYYFYIACNGQFTNDAVVHALNQVGWGSAQLESKTTDENRLVSVYEVPYSVVAALIESRKSDSRYKFVAYVQEQGRKVVRRWFKQGKLLSDKEREALKKLEELRQKQKK